MKLLRHVPLVLSALLLAAHFYRSGRVGVVALVLAVPLLLITRERWATIAVRLFLALAAIEWLRTAFVIAQERQALGAPFARMLVILGTVALFTAASALPLRRT